MVKKNKENRRFTGLKTRVNSTKPSYRKINSDNNKNRKGISNMKDDNLQDPGKKILDNLAKKNNAKNNVLHESAGAVAQERDMEPVINKEENLINAIVKQLRENNSIKVRFLSQNEIDNIADKIVKSPVLKGNLPDSAIKNIVDNLNKHQGNRNIEYMSDDELYNTIENIVDRLKNRSKQTIDEHSYNREDNNMVKANDKQKSVKERTQEFENKMRQRNDRVGEILNDDLSDILTSEDIRELSSTKDDDITNNIDALGSISDMLSTRYTDDINKINEDIDDAIAKGSDDGIIEELKVRLENINKEYDGDKNRIDEQIQKLENENRITDQSGPSSGAIPKVHTNNLDTIPEIPNIPDPVEDKSVEDYQKRVDKAVEERIEIEGADLDMEIAEDNRRFQALLNELAMPPYQPLDYQLDTDSEIDDNDQELESDEYSNRSHDTSSGYNSTTISPTSSKESLNAYGYNGVDPYDPTIDNVARLEDLEYDGISVTSGDLEDLEYDGISVTSGDLEDQEIDLTAAYKIPGEELKSTDMNRVALRDNNLTPEALARQARIENKRQEVSERSQGDIIKNPIPLTEQGVLRGQHVKTMSKINDVIVSLNKLSPILDDKGNNYVKTFEDARKNVTKKYESITTVNLNSDIQNSKQAKSYLNAVEDLQSVNKELISKSNYLLDKNDDKNAINFEYATDLQNTTKNLDLTVEGLKNNIISLTTDNKSMTTKPGLEGYQKHTVNSSNPYESVKLKSTNIGNDKTKHTVNSSNPYESVKLKSTNIGNDKTKHTVNSSNPYESVKLKSLKSPASKIDDINITKLSSEPDKGLDR